MKIQDMIDNVIGSYAKEQSRGMCYFIGANFWGSSEESCIFGEEIYCYLLNIKGMTREKLPHSYLVTTLGNFYLGEGLSFTLQECYEVCLKIYQDWENKPTCKGSLIKMLRSVQSGA